ncbi:MAG: hypothetical protein EBT89_09245 [Opitutaceae bacterium]|nr:hypothetical protein [Opitutaceae bacterium]
MNNDSSQQHFEDDSIDFGELFGRLKRGLPMILGLAALGLALTAGGYYVGGQFLSVSTNTRVVFSFTGFEKGEYPDKSKFSPDDLRAPDNIAEALKRKGLATSEEAQTQVRAALTVEAIIPDSIIKERDKLRAAGQTPRLYVPDEYTLTLTLPRKFPMSPREREVLLSEIVTVFQENFIRTYVAMPLNFGKAFESLLDADYSDYELVLHQEAKNIDQLLTTLSGKIGDEQISTGTMSRSFRSPRTQLTFSDLLKQSQLFMQIRLNETLGLIRQHGISKDRSLALLKMDFHIKSLIDDENKAIEEEKVVQALLKQTQEGAQKYVLGVKSQNGPQRADATVVDQGLLDSLLANDAYNFLIRKSLTASLATRGIQSQKSIVLNQKANLQSFNEESLAQRIDTIAQFNKSLDALKKVYTRLINDIQLTYTDYQKQQFGDAVRISMQTRTESFYRSLAMAGIAGLGIGGALGLGLSLLGLGGGRLSAKR